MAPIVKAGRRPAAHIMRPDNTCAQINYTGWGVDQFRVAIEFGGKDGNTTVSFCYSCGA
jgi:hypothetical protein